MSRILITMLKFAGAGVAGQPVERDTLLGEAAASSRAEHWELVEHLLRPLVKAGDEAALALTLAALLHDDERYLDALLGLLDAASCGNGMAAHELAELHGLFQDEGCAERYRRVAAAAGWTSPRPPVLARTAAQTLAKAWFDQPQPTWAFDEVRRYVEREPTNALVALDALINAAPDTDGLGLVGAGPLEDLVRTFGGEVVGDLEARASDTRWSEALRNVWLEDADDEVTRRLEAIGCTQLRHR